jgi:hypothetical protein
MPRTDGTDVSQYQGVINWSAVRATGIQWVGIRATHAYTDSQFAANRTGASWARWRLLYDYADPGGDATNYLRAVVAFAPGEGAMLDAEAPGLTEADCLRWLDQVEAVTHRPAAVYTGKYTAGGTIWNSPRIFNGTRPRILAAYVSEPVARALAAPYGWDAWQWTDKGSLLGVRTLVDLDQVDDPAAFDRCCYPTPVEEPMPTAEEYATADWAAYLKSPDVAGWENIVLPASTWLTDGRIFAQGAHQEILIVKEMMTNLTKALAAAGIGDPESVKALLREVVREELDQTILTTRPLS